jgi:hypothetical protein
MDLSATDVVILAVIAALVLAAVLALWLVDKRR